MTCSQDYETTFKDPKKDVMKKVTTATQESNSVVTALLNKETPLEEHLAREEVLGDNHQQSLEDSLDVPESAKQLCG